MEAKNPDHNAFICLNIYTYRTFTLSRDENKFINEWAMTLWY